MKKKSAAKLQSDRIGVGKFSDSKKRWWQDKSLEASEPPCFQRFQFDSGLGRKDSADEALSPRAMAAAYGDNTISWHIEKLLFGIHKLISG